MGEFSLTHILLVAAILLLFFGPSKLPALGQSLGQAIRGFKKGLEETSTPVKSNQERAEAKAIRAEPKDVQAHLTAEAVAEEKIHQKV